MDEHTEGRYKQRVDELEVSEVLNMLAGARNTRQQPGPGDLPGEFDAWFDGGAIKWETGCTQYFFANGVTARVPVIPTLCVSIRFPDGRRVAIEQKTDN